MKLATVVRLLKRVKAYGTSEGVTKAWDTRGRTHHDDYLHGIHIGIFNRPEHPNQFAPNTSRYFKQPAATKAEREAVTRAFKGAERIGTRLVNLADLTPMQKTILDSRVQRMEQKRGEPEWMAAHLPTVFNHNGKQYVIDGHHRLAYDVNMGEQTSLAKVYAVRKTGNA